MYRHVFWDLGGTLVDTYPQLDEAFADVVRRHGHSIDLLDVSRLTRRSTGDAVRALADQFSIDPAEFETANAELKELWTTTTPAPAMPGAAEIMDLVRSQGGLNLVVTHRDRGSAQGLLDGLGLVAEDLVSTADGYPRKPDPTMFHVLLARHGLDAAQCLAVGDRPIDIEAAQAAGMSAAILECPSAPVEDDAEFSVAELNELRHILVLG